MRARVMRAGGVFGACVVLLATAAAAQGPADMAGRMVRFGFGGGFSVPTDNAADALRNGVNGQAYVLANLGFVPVRLNLGYQRFEFEQLTPGLDGATTILSGVGGVSLPLVRVGPISPYITAGLGMFNVKNDVDGTGVSTSDSQTKFGVDGGAGLSLRIGRLDAFIEGRVQNVYTDEGVIDAKSIRSIPVTFGILF